MFTLTHSAWCEEMFLNNLVAYFSLAVRDRRVFNLSTFESSDAFCIKTNRKEKVCLSSSTILLGKKRVMGRTHKVLL